MHSELNSDVTPRSSTITPGSMCERSEVDQKRNVKHDAHITKVGPEPSMEAHQVLPSTVSLNRIAVSQSESCVFITHGSSADTARRNVVNESSVNITHRCVGYALRSIAAAPSGEALHEVFVDQCSFINSNKETPSSVDDTGTLADYKPVVISDVGAVVDVEPLKDEHNEVPSVMVAENSSAVSGNGSSMDITHGSPGYAPRSIAAGLCEEALHEEHDELCSLIKSDNEEAPSVVDDTATLSHYDPVVIPEFDALNDFALMPKWMTFDPTQQIRSEKYSCKLCEVRVPPKDAEEHVKGRKHYNRLCRFPLRSLDSFQTLSISIAENQKRELRLYTHENISMMSDGLEALTTGKEETVSVGFVIDDGHLICLSFATDKICMNIDRSILRQTDTLKNMVEFKDIFEGQCNVKCVNMWELVLVLYHRYGIRCISVDLEDGETQDAGVDVPLENVKLHMQVTTEAVKCYDLVDDCQKKQISCKTIPEVVLKHICTLNEHMYGIYREVRVTDLKVVWRDRPVVENGKICKIKCEEYPSRIRKNSLVQIYEGDRVISGKCYEWRL